MGTKRQLAPAIASIVAEFSPGPFLDLFSGMCSVGCTVGPYRQVWSNDLQWFAHFVADAVFCSAASPPSGIEAATLCRQVFSQNVAHLETRFSNALHEERCALDTSDVQRMHSAVAAFPWFGRNKVAADEQRRLRHRSTTFPYRLFTFSFSGTYFGLGQCIAIDSLKYAFDSLRRDQVIDDDAHRWFCLALCQALSRCTTSPGHFAQPLGLKAGNSARFFRQRRRSIWKEWLEGLSELAPIGSKDWRTRNRCFQADANDLLAQMKKLRSRPAVIYADPPYTKDQYSRFYHVYETLLLYDYPALEGTGRCRAGRATSDFSLATRVDSALSTLIAEAADLGSSLVISYPKNGLLEDSFERIPQLLRRNFRRVHAPVVIDHFHSAMGASKGAERYAVTEVIYSASR